MSWSFDRARKYPMPFGKYVGQSLDTIAKTDEGLQYLDWVSGLSQLGDGIRAAITVYLEDPAIKKDLEQTYE